MLRYFLIFGVTLILLSTGCQYFEDKDDKRKKTPVARVGIDYLYRSELDASLPINLSVADSSAIAESVIEDWLVQKLMEEKALDFLPQKKIESIERKVANYKSALYAFQYEQELLSQKMNTNISDEEFQEYLTINPSAAIISTPLIFTRFFIVNNGAENESALKKWLIEEEDHEEEQILEWASEDATQYSIEGKWMSVDQAAKMLPQKIPQSKFLRQNHLIEMKDNQYSYLFWIERFKVRGKIPEGYQSDGMKRILINQKKENYLKEIKKKLLNEGYNKKLVDRY